MPKAYAVITYRSISDPQKHAAYSKLAVPAVTPFGARILAFGNAAVAVEHGLKERTVVVEYPTVRAGINYKFNWGPSATAVGHTRVPPSARRFPPPWTVDKTKAWFMVRIRNPLLTKAAQRTAGGHRHRETSMSIESLTYAELGDRLGASPEAARSVARRLRLTRRPGNDGKVRVIVDLAEIQYKPLLARSPGGHWTEIDGLNARIEQLQVELASLEVEKRCLEACAAGHRADFEHERKRLDTLMTETRTLANFAMSAREKAARLEGELSAAWTRRRWWTWLVAPRVAPPSRNSPVLVGVPVRI